MRLQRGITIALIVVTGLGVLVNALYNATIWNSDPLDFSVFNGPGIEILHGQWRGVFADPVIQAGVFELVFWGLVEIAGVTGTGGWTIFFVIVMAILAVVLALVSERALRAVTTSWSVQLAWGVAAISALSATLLSPLTHGHPAQFVNPLIWIGAGMLARRDRPVAAASLLALSAGWELWGLLGVPVLLLAPRIGWSTIWRSAVAGAAVVAALFLPFALLGSFHMFEFAWPVSEGTLAHLIAPEAENFAWPLRLAQGVLSIGAGAAVALVLRGRADTVWIVPLAVCAVRLLLDPVAAGYYVVAPTILLVLGIAHCVAQRHWLALGALVLALNVAIVVPQRTLLASGAFLVLVAATVPLLLWSGRRRESAPAPVPR